MEIIIHTFERFFGPVDWKRLKTDVLCQSLVEEGFSPKEAKELSWLYGHRNIGRNFGFVLGIGVAYCCNSWITRWTYNIPYLRLHRSSLWVSRALVVFGTLQLFDYYSTARRKGGDSGLAHDLMWVNTRYTESKERFIRNFEVLNRKLSDIEKEILTARQIQLTSPIKDRRWVYNPYIHGSDEEAFWSNVRRNFLDKLPPWERYDVQQQIAADNKEKIAEGEQIRLKPYKLTDDVDTSGVKFGFRRNPFVNNWTPLQ
ncbi:unnamed protein product [Paramecium primaurelia]|uniref:Uncharacterized protein n=1 Tax=Paramecium primaurelia TaxID=5886 RepID=A0A8S1NRI2_PARPR|nr:unnamed protein product [Paramecium primaurelia]